MAADETRRYTRVAMVLHWLMALIVIGNLAGGLLLDRFMDSADPAMRAFGQTIIGAHKAAGLAVLTLTLLRIGWRLGHRPPPLPAHMTPMERGLARTVHTGFYGLILALPLSGWSMVSTGKEAAPIGILGMFRVPPLALPQSWHIVFGQGHALLGWVMLALMALHVAAVVKHRVFDRDRLIARMLPERYPCAGR